MAPAALRTPPEGFSALIDLEPTLRLDIRYHTKHNFTGAPLPGYGAPGAWMLTEAAERVASIHRRFRSEGCGLLIYDAYRPRRATQAMVAWAERTGQIALVENGYIARESLHARGTTIDLSLFELSTGAPLEMGTEWDVFHEGSHTANATGEAKVNRQRLAEAFLNAGFRGYSKEWWHFTLNVETEPPGRDVPYGADEADEVRNG